MYCNLITSYAGCVYQVLLILKQFLCSFVGPFFKHSQSINQYSFNKQMTKCIGSSVYIHTCVKPRYFSTFSDT